MEPSLLFCIFAGFGFLLTALGEWILIPVLRAHKLGQKILEIGPSWHEKKNGTPTMGGIAFLITFVLIFLIFFIQKSVSGEVEDYLPLALMLSFAVANGMIGFADDYCKLIKKQNQGLTWRQKLILQLTVSAAFSIVSVYMGLVDLSIKIPFTDRVFNLSWWFYPISVILLCGVINGCNLTDGIDGLATSVTAIAAIFYTVVFLLAKEKNLLPFSAVLLGCTFAFLIFNFHPAKVFMGDTGSLFFGAAIIGMAFEAGELCSGLLVAGIYIIEMLSSFFQVLYFRLTHGKRLFLMAPIHHHFEELGWSENKIVAVFSFVELFFCALAWFAVWGIG